MTANEQKSIENLQKDHGNLCACRPCMIRRGNGATHKTLLESENCENTLEVQAQQNCENTLEVQAQQNTSSSQRQYQWKSPQDNGKIFCANPKKSKSERKTGN